MAGSSSAPPPPPCESPGPTAACTARRRCTQAQHSNTGYVGVRARAHTAPEQPWGSTPLPTRRSQPPVQPHTAPQVHAGPPPLRTSAGSAERPGAAAAQGCGPPAWTRRRRPPDPTRGAPRGPSAAPPPRPRPRAPAGSAAAVGWHNKQTQRGGVGGQWAQGYLLPPHPSPPPPTHTWKAAPSHRARPRHPNIHARKPASASHRQTRSH
jgi:hypothetical protein